MVEDFGGPLALGAWGKLPLLPPPLGGPAKYHMYMQFSLNGTLLCTFSLHGSYLHPVQEVCLIGLTQLLHYLFVATASCKQNCSAVILREGGKSGLYMMWVLVW